VRASPPAGRPPRAWVLAATLGAAAASVLALPAGPQDAATGQGLEAVLAKARAYCLRLDRAALDFTCVEKIEERTYQNSELQPDVVVGSPVSTGEAHYAYTMPRQTYYAHTYVYDYQYVRTADRKTERRTLLEEDGRKMKTDNAELTTSTIRVQNAIFGPVGLIGETAQAGHDFRISGEETQKGQKIVIVEAVPKPGLERQHCYGRLWVREADGVVVKIAWDQASVGNFRMIQARAQRFGAEPQLTSITEYGMEKNGLRFPSKDTTEEAYRKGGKTFVQSLTTILYKDYKFFTVETTVQY
jgi:hypothetical protein